jgi:1,4-dihydroxy-2-naphthoate polyprenyltransferase
MLTRSTGNRTSRAFPAVRDAVMEGISEGISEALMNSDGEPSRIESARPSTPRAFLLGARPRTLPAAIVPVAVGTAVAWWWLGEHHLEWWRAGAALVVAFGVQVGTNYANDYSDGVRGTDEVRVGPIRLVASGQATPRAVATASIIAFGVAGVAGLLLAAYTSWWLLAVGAACIAAGWLYTGGPKPYGYMGLGELFVFAFFGVVATGGSAYVQGVRISSTGFGIALLASIAVGMLATALLQANNLRDITGDTVANKRTLAVRLGRRRGGFLYVGTLVVAVIAVVLIAALERPWSLLTLAAAPLAVSPSELALGKKEGRDLLPLLAGTARLQLCAGALLAIGMVI